MKNIEKILLINPFNTEDSYNFKDIISKGIEVHPPLGLGYLSSYFKKYLPYIKIEVFDANAQAIKVCIEDNGVDMLKLWEMLRNKIIDYSPDMVGISCLFHTTAISSHKTALIIKEISSDIHVVTGGNYAHTSYDEVLKDHNIDFVVFSEGEIVLTNLVNNINKKINLQNVNGIAYRNEMSTIVKTNEQEMIKDIDNIPECDRSNFDIDFYSRQGRYFTSRFLDRKTTRMTTLVASRGCPQKCTFCSARLVWKGNIRYRNPSLVVDEMLYLRDTFGTNTFFFVDDNMFSSKKDIINLANEISQRIPGISWTCISGMQISSLDNDVVRSIYKSGCKWFILPIESGDSLTLKIIKKPHTAKIVRNAIDIIRKYEDTWIAGNIITGFPFQTKKDIEDSLNYAKTLDLDWIYFFGFIPLPGTKLYQECLESGFISKSRELSTLSTPNFDSDYITESNYVANVEYNFFKNRNIKLRPMQAIRDFQYVLDTTNEHALAMYSIGKSYQEMKNYEEAERWFLLTLKIINSQNSINDKVHSGSINKSFFLTKKINYSKYFENSNIDIAECLREVSFLKDNYKYK